jgi:hypothetical protein
MFLSRCAPNAIRRANVGDADAIAALHASSWRSAYRGIFKDATLGPALDVERTIPARDNRIVDELIFF